MMANVLLLIGLVLMVVGATQRRTRWGAHALSAGVVLVVAVLLLMWADRSEFILGG
jgi:uncharacterized membrane protein YqjE